MNIMKKNKQEKKQEKKQDQKLIHPPQPSNDAEFIEWSKPGGGMDRVFAEHHPELHPDQFVIFSAEDIVDKASFDSVMGLENPNTEKIITYPHTEADEEFNRSMGIPPSETSKDSTNQPENPNTEK
jgi:hypothetical protein